MVGLKNLGRVLSLLEWMGMWPNQECFSQCGARQKMVSGASHPSSSSKRVPCDLLHIPGWQCHFFDIPVKDFHEQMRVMLHYQHANKRAMTVPAWYICGLGTTVSNTRTLPIALYGLDDIKVVQLVATGMSLKVKGEGKTWGLKRLPIVNSLHVLHLGLKFLL